IAPGSSGDLVVVDPREEYVVREEDLYYKHRLSPYIGWRLKGRVKYTILKGVVVARDGVVEGKPVGSWVKPVR
ncbi:MAG: allantoinase, partial [Thermogladius sp.]